MESHQTTTDRILSIRWSGRGKVSRRQSAWGGQMHAWGATRLSTSVYIIPKRVTVAEIADALEAVLLPSDAAVLAYPHGSTSRGASAMRVRLFGADANAG
jgi:hypothetical protein